MTVSKIIGHQAGIQYQGVKDYSEANPRTALVNALFTGSFRHGDFNKPFKVTKADYRAKLGYDPENLDFVAIEDALNNGAPFIWVMRISNKKPVVSISCAGASNSTLASFEPNVTYKITSNDEVLFNGKVLSSYAGGTYGDIVVKMVLDNDDTVFYFSNTSLTTDIKIIFEAFLDDGVTPSHPFKDIPQDNPAILLDGKHDSEPNNYSRVLFCLCHTEPQ